MFKTCLHLLLCE